jgi:ABC-type lipoprotein release transport system permease subunit
MWRWALRSFLDERASLLASAGGVAVVFLLVFVVDGAFRGEADQIVSFIEQSGATVWVLQKGVSNVHMAASGLGEDVAARLRARPEVAHVEGILYGGALAGIGRVEQAIYLVGVRPGQRTGAWDLAAGARQPGRGEVVVPEVLARRGGVGLGEPVTIHRRVFRVAGLSRGTYSMANSLAFLHAADLAALFDTVADASYFLVWPRPGVAPEQLLEAARAAAPNASVLSRRELIANDHALGLQMGASLIRIMTAVAGLVAALIVGFTTYTFTARRARDLAIARAVGARPAQLLLATAAQAGALAMTGYATAVLLAAALQPVLTALSPGIIIHFSAAVMARMGLAALAVALLSAAWPALRVLRIDPAVAFSA